MNKLTLKENDYLFVTRRQLHDETRENKRMRVSRKLLSATRGLSLAAAIIMLVFASVSSALTADFNSGNYSSRTVIDIIVMSYAVIVLLILVCVTFARSSKTKYTDATYFRIANINVNRFLVIGLIAFAFAVYRTNALTNAPQIAAAWIVFAVFIVICIFYGVSVLLCAVNKYFLYRLTPEDYIDYNNCKL